MTKEMLKFIKSLNNGWGLKIPKDIEDTKMINYLLVRLSFFSLELS